LLVSDLHKLFFKELNNRNLRFLIVGMSSAVLQGAPVVTEDLDIWVEKLGGPDFQEAVKSSGGFYVPPFSGNDPMLGPGDLGVIDLVVNLDGIGSFDEEWSNSLSIEFDGVIVRLLPIERVLHSKRTANRQKDIAAIPILETTINILNKKPL
jgi:hypothetical protein